jgi:hypothetical protein
MLLLVLACVVLFERESSAPRTVSERILYCMAQVTSYHTRMTTDVHILFIVVGRYTYCTRYCTEQI